MAEAQPIEKPFRYEFPRAALTVDVVAFAHIDKTIRILLIRRKNAPFADHWALPGGFLEENEPIEEGALRELKEETQLVPRGKLTHVGAFGNPGRDPRGWTISLAYLGLIGPPVPDIKGSDDATEAKWFDLKSLPPLAFDHAEILGRARIRFLTALNLGDLGLELLPNQFTFADMKRLMDAIGEADDEAENWQEFLLSVGRIENVPGSRTKFRAVEETV